MEKKQRIFIYDRKEMAVLVLLAVMVAVFAFTLGVHLGKRVGPRQVVGESHETAAVETAPDELPNRQELQEKSKNVQQSGDEALSKALHDEVARTGIKLDAPRQVELPRDKPMPPAARKQSALPTETARSEPPLPTTVETRKFVGGVEDIGASKRTAPEGRFTLQIGAYSSLAEAKDQVDSMEALGLKPVLRAVTLKGKGRWYRIFVGGFPSKDDAMRAGERYRTEHVIDSFIVSKNAD